MLNDRLVLLGVAGLATIATAGWMRTPAAVPAGSMVNGFQPPQEMVLADPALPVTSASLPVPYTAAPQQFRAPAAPAVAVARSQPVPAASVRHSDNSQVVTRARRAPVVYDDRNVMVEKTRSKKQSAAIIGGGAAAGAAIGAVAGGGKGAVIGAVSGGGAGLVYDRMTAKKRVPASEVEPGENYRYRGTSDDDRREGRSTAKSAAIIGGGAAAGAAVGAAAGGGKGAAIGALGGGAAGYVYDRMTKNR